MKKLISALLVLAMLLSIAPAKGLAAGEAPAAETNAEAALALIGAHESLAQPFETEENQPDPDTRITVIVVLDESELPESGLPTKVARARMQKQQLALQREISETVLNGEALEIRHSYTTLTNAFSAEMTYAQMLAVRELDNVVAAYQAPVFEVEPNMNTSNEMVGGGSYNLTGYSGAGTVIAILDTGVDLDHEVFVGAPEDPRLTQADIQKLLDENDLNCEAYVKGVGASSLYYSAKIPFQFDYGEQDADGNPPASGGEHGTHVAATAAANDGVKEGFSGVAPEAQIVNMKVFQDGGGATFDDVVAALEDCVILGVDAANLSLGSDCGFIDFESEDEWTQNLLNVFHRAGENGVCLSVAVGNAYSAAYGNNYGGKALASNPDYGNASMPATFDESLAVAATENAGMMSPYITVNGQNIAYYDGYDMATFEVTTEYAFRTLANNGTLEYVVVPGVGKAEDYEGLDLTGKIALVSRGETTYEEKANCAADAGAVGMVVYNNISGMVYMSIAAWRIPIAFISKQDGAYLVEQENKTLTIGTADALVASPVAGMCDFSSWGATSELTLKPEITAPGGNIYSAVPGNQYELMSGTSMAAPHVAGGMAVIRKALTERYPGLTAGEIKDLVDTVLMSTAQIIYDGDTPRFSQKAGCRSDEHQRCHQWHGLHYRCRNGAAQDGAGGRCELQWCLHPVLHDP